MNYAMNGIKLISKDLGVSDSRIRTLEYISKNLAFVICDSVSLKFSLQNQKVTARALLELGAGE